MSGPVYLHEQDALRRLLSQVREVVARVMFDLDIVNWPGKYGKRPTIDYYLVWLQWSRCYNIALPHLIKTIVIEYRRRLCKSGGSLGISIQVLTSPRVEAWIASQFKREERTSRRPPLPSRYNSLEDYVEHMALLRRAGKQPAVNRVYRGSPAWRRPVVDIVRSRFKI